LIPELCNEDLDVYGFHIESNPINDILIKHKKLDGKVECIIMDPSHWLSSANNSPTNAFKPILIVDSEKQFIAEIPNENAAFAINMFKAILCGDPETLKEFLSAANTDKDLSLPKLEAHNLKFEKIWREVSRYCEIHSMLLKLQNTEFYREVQALLKFCTETLNITNTANIRIIDHLVKNEDDSSTQSKEALQCTLKAVWDIENGCILQHEDVCNSLLLLPPMLMLSHPFT
jgi:hypothetical protein